MVYNSIDHEKCGSFAFYNNTEHFTNELVGKSEQNCMCARDSTFLLEANVYVLNFAQMS